MSTRFAQIFWGLLLVILDLRINRIDILPDFLGYILVALGCGGLTSFSRDFSTARTLSWILVAFALVGYVLHGSAATVFGILNLAVDCAMMWFLLGGVMELAMARQRSDLSERASNRRIAYVVVMCLATLASLVAQGSRELAVVMVVVLVICILPLLFLILHLIHRAKHELTGDHDA
jgi:low temperature requirement protein LtrA